MVYGESLAFEEIGLMNQARNAIHLDQILYVLLLAEALQSIIELTVFANAIPYPGRSIAASTTTAANVEEHPIEEVGAEGGIKLTAVLNT